MSAAVLLLGVTVAIGLEVAASPTTASHASTASALTLRWLALAASLLLLGTTVLAVATTSSVGLAGAGAGLVILGGWLRAAAMRNLGAHFRTEAGADALVTTGIHGVMRHPSELGVLAWALGLFVASPSGLAFALALGQLPLLGLRLRIEESALAERFGATWLRYAAETPPFGF